MLTVACVLKSGGIYTPEWVDRLRTGVARHLVLPHHFVCLSDVEVPCERIPLKHNWPGWWSKIELFGLKGPVLYLDLDTAITGDLTDIARYVLNPVSGFTILTDFYRPNGWGSGVMSWNGTVAQDDLARWYAGFLADPEFWMLTCRHGGDQEFIMQQKHRATHSWQTTGRGAFAGQIVSYKVHCGRGIPSGARIVCLHGEPKFNDMAPSDPVRRAWEMAA